MEFKNNQIYVQTKDINNPGADKRCKDLLKWPVIPKGTRWQCIVREVETFGMLPDLPTRYVTSLRQFDGQRWYHTEIHARNSPCKTNKYGDQVGPNLWDLLIDSLVEDIPKSVNDYLRTLNPHPHDEQTILQWLVDNGKVTLEQIKEAHEEVDKEYAEREL